MERSHTIRRFIAAILSVMLVFSAIPTKVIADKNTHAVAASTENQLVEKAVKTKSIKITGSKYVAKGKKITLKAAVSPAEASQKVTWSTSDKKIATVNSKGVVKGVKAGKVTITATSKENKKVKKTFKLEVKAKAVSKVTVTGAKDLDLAGTKSVTLKTKIAPSKAAKTVEWKSSNTKVAKVSSKGKVTAVGVGTAKITATATDGSKKKATVTIQVINSADQSPTAVPSETPTVEPTETPTPEPTATPIPTDYDFSAGQFSYHYSAASDDLTLTASSASGHFTVPAQENNKPVTQISENALTGGNVNAVTVPEGVNTIAPQNFPSRVNYMELKGKDTTLTALSNVNFIIAPAGGKAEQTANALGINFVDASKVRSQGGFLYIVDNGQATLLCAVDSSAVNGVVTIPDTVDGVPVTGADPHALDGCADQITQLNYPESMSLPEGIIAPDKLNKIVKVSSILLSGAPAEMLSGEAVTVSAEVQPENASDKTLSWSSSDPAVLTVSADGLVTAVRYGQAQITALANDGSAVSAAVSVQVWNVPQSIAIQELKTDFETGDSTVLKAVTVPDVTTLEQQEILWSTSDPAVASVDADTLTALSAGSAVISAQIKDTDISASQPIQVYDKTESIAISGGKEEMTAGETLSLSAVVQPDTAIQKVTWATSDTAVATVVDGLVTAVAGGDVTISAQAGSKTDSISIHVWDKVASISITGVGKLDLYQDRKVTLQLTAEVLPATARQGVTWSSDHPEIASVNELGVVSAVAVGDATITATAADGSSIAASAVITVERNAYSVQENADGTVTLTDFEVQNGVATIPDSIDGKTVSAIASGLFKSNAALTELTVPDTITVIPESLCEDCSALKKVTLSNAVTAIGNRAFKNCTALSSLSSVSSRRSKSAGSLQLPSSLKTIGAEAFMGDSSLTGVLEMPAGVTSVGENAFSGTGITEMTLPTGLSDTVAEQLQAEYPEITFNQTEPSLEIKTITFEAKQEELGNTVTWTVETSNVEQVKSYNYSLAKDGTEIAAESNATDPTYSAFLDQAGSYQLNVTVTAKDGSVVTGSSPLYVATAAMKMTCPETLQNGEDLVIQVEKVTGAIQYGVIITNASTGELVQASTFAGPGNISVLGYDLDRGDYTVAGYVYGNAFHNTVPTVKTVKVLGEKPLAPTVTLSNVVPDGWQMYCSFQIDPKSFENAVIKQKEENWEEEYTSYAWDINDGIYSAYYGSAVTVSFCIKQDGRWSSWSEALEVEFQGAEQLAAPEITMDDEFPEGKDISLSFTESENADWYHIYIYREEELYGDQLLGSSYKKPGTYTLERSGIKLPAGTYVLLMNVYNEEGAYRENNSQKIFRVTENDQRPTVPEVTVNKTEAGYGNTFTFSVTSASADYVAMKSTYTKKSGTQLYNDSDRTFDANGDVTSISQYRNENYLDCTFHFTFAVQKDGIWSKYSDPVDVTIVEPEKLPEPVLHIPDDPQAGQDLVVSFDAVEGAKWYNAIIYRDDQQVAYYDEDFAGSLTCRGWNVSAGTYRAEITVYDESGEYAPCTVEKEFEVTGDRPDGPFVTSDKTIFRKAEKPVFTIETSDIDMIHWECVQVFENGQADTWRNSFETWEAETKWESFNLSKYNGKVDFQFYAFSNGIWSKATEISMDVEEAVDDVLGDPGIIMNSEFEAGEDIQFTIEPAENTQYYWFYIYNQAGSIIYEGYIDEEPFELDKTIPGYYFSSGIYKIIVWATGAGDEKSTEMQFLVSGDFMDAPEATAAKEMVSPGTQATFTVQTDGAERVAYREYTVGNSSPEYWSTATSGSTTQLTRYISGSAGTRYGYAFSVKRNGKWSAWSTPITIIVAEQEQLEAPTFTANAPSAGEDLTVAINETVQANSYEVIVRKDNQQIFYNVYNNATTVTIPGYNIDAGNYNIQLKAIDGTGEYAASIAEETVTVSGTRSDAPQAEVDKGTVLTNENYTFTVQTDGAERVAYSLTSNSWNNSGTQLVIGDAYTWRTYQYIAGEYTYRFALLKDEKWSAWSDPITITVKLLEPLDPPEFSVNETYQNGEDLTIEVDEVANAGSYRVSISDTYDTKYYTSDYSSTRIFTVPGYYLNAGKYTVKVEALGNGYLASSLNKEITVIGERGEKPVVTVDKNSVAYAKPFMFTIDSVSVEEIAYRNYVIGSNDIYYGKIVVKDDETTWSTSTYGSVGARYNYSFSVRRDGKWSAWSDSIVITIIEQPPLNLPVITVNNPAAGEDLTIAFQEVENANRYWAEILFDGSQIYYSDLFSARKLTIPGYRIEAGDYRVILTAIDDSGEYASSKTEETVTVSGTRTGAPLVEVDTNTVLQNKYFSFTVQTEGAERIACNYGGTSMTNYGMQSCLDEIYIWKTSQYYTGEYRYQFALLKDGKWTAWSNPITITVEAGQPQEKPSISMNNAYQNGEDIIIGVSCVQNVSYYNVNIYDEYDINCYSTHLYEDSEVTIPGYRLPAGEYTVNVAAYADGYASTNAYGSFVIEGTRPAAPEASFVSMSPDTAGEQYRTIKFNVNAASAEKIACRYWQRGVNNVSYASFAESINPSELSISNWFDNESIYCFSFSVYQDGRWSAWSSIIKINDN